MVEGGDDAIPVALAFQLHVIAHGLDARGGELIHLKYPPCRHPEVRALARLEGWPQAICSPPSRLAEDGEHLRMTAAV
jgi:hypothetical protein